MHPGELFCEDAYTTEPRGRQPKFTASGVGFEALNPTGFDPIPGTAAGLSDAPGYFSKSPIYLSKGVTWAEVTALKGDVMFAWVPARVWTSASGWSLAAYAAPTVRFESCAGGYTGFLGGVTTPTARACLTLGVRSSLHPDVEAVQVSIGKNACS